MGRFINADSFTSTGAGALGFNMFSYCNNNPVVFTDPNGNKPEYSGDPNYEWAWDLGWIIKEFLEKKRNDRQEQEKRERAYIENGVVTYEKTSGGARINNSYLINSPHIMYEYIHENRGDEVAGSTTGVFFEWAVHNVLYQFCEVISWDTYKPNLASVDFGKTIFSDKHEGVMAFFSLGMQTVYCLFSPLTAPADLMIETERWDLLYAE